jgi:hypothetical protein
VRSTPAAIEMNSDLSAAGRHANYGVTFIDFVDGLTRSELPVLGIVEGATGFDGLLVCQKAVTQFFLNRVKRNAALIGSIDAAKKIGVMLDGLIPLIAGGRIKPVRGTGLTGWPLFVLREIESFKRTYVLKRQLIEMSAADEEVVSKELRDMRLYPAIVHGSEAGPILYYHWDEIFQGRAARVRGRLRRRETAQGSDCRRQG